MTATPADREAAEDLLPWAPTDDDALDYRRDLIAQALATARDEGYAAGLAAGRRPGRTS